MIFKSNKNNHGIPLLISFKAEGHMRYPPSISSSPKKTARHYKSRTIGMRNLLGSALLFIENRITDMVLLHYRHTPPQLHNLPHHIRITHHPIIHPGQLILPIPALYRITGFKEAFSPVLLKIGTAPTNQTLLIYTNNPLNNTS